MNDITVPFTYSNLPAPVAAEVEAATTRIKDRQTRQVKDIIETGRDLLEVKSKLEHGQFESWLDGEFGMAVRTAQRFMRASEWAQDKNDIVSHLTPTTVYMLSAKSTPESVHVQVVERLEGGLPAEPEYVRHVVLEAKLREREAKDRKGKREARKARENRRNTKEQEEQAADRQCDLELRVVQREAEGVAKFLRDRLSAEDFSTFRIAIVDYSVYAAFLRVLVDGSVAEIFPSEPPWKSS